MAKPLLAAETIYEMALELLDREGLDGLSARKLTQALSCSPNTLYRQVGNRETMIAGLLNYYFSSRPLQFDSSGSWQQGATAWALSLRDIFLAHPNLSRLLTIDQRQPLANYANQLLKILLANDFPLEFALRASRVLIHLVISLTLAEIETPPIPTRRRRRPRSELDFEDMVIQQSGQGDWQTFQDLPEVFANAIEFSILGIAERLQAVKK